MKFVGIVHYKHGRKSIKEKDREKSIEMATIFVFFSIFPVRIQLNDNSKYEGRIKA